MPVMYDCFFEWMQGQYRPEQVNLNPENSPSYSEVKKLPYKGFETLVGRGLVVGDSWCTGGEGGKYGFEGVKLKTIEDLRVFSRERIAQDGRVSSSGPRPMIFDPVDEILTDGLMLPLVAKVMDATPEKITLRYSRDVWSFYYGIGWPNIQRSPILDHGGGDYLLD